MQHVRPFLLSMRHRSGGFNASHTACPAVSALLPHLHRTLVGLGTPSNSPSLAAAHPALFLPPIPGGRRAAPRDALALQVPPRQGAGQPREQRTNHARAVHAACDSSAQWPDAGASERTPHPPAPVGHMPSGRHQPYRSRPCGPLAFQTRLTGRVTVTVNTPSSPSSCRPPSPAPRSGPRPCPATWWTACAPRAHTPPTLASPPPQWRHAAARTRRARRGAAGHGTRGARERHRANPAGTGCWISTSLNPSHAIAERNWSWQSG